MVNPADWESAVRARFFAASGLHLRLSFPSVPSTRPLIVQNVAAHLHAHGRALGANEQRALEQALDEKLAEGFAASPQSIVEIEVKHALGVLAKSEFSVRARAMNAYALWQTEREPPYFGSAADAKVLDVIASLPAPARVLDVGAGTGRNTLALAERGARVDAVELDAHFFSLLEQACARVTPRPSVVHGNFLEVALPRPPYDALVFAEVLSSHVHGPSALAKFFSRAKEVLAPGGLVVASVFLANAPDFPVSTPLREMGEHTLTSVFTRTELERALSGFALVTDESLLAYEKPRAKTWPPTPWFERWAQGYDLFLMQAAPPVELRWIVSRVA